MLFCIRVSVRLRKNERKLFSALLKGYVHGCKISVKKEYGGIVCGYGSVLSLLCNIIFVVTEKYMEKVVTVSLYHPFYNYKRVLYRV